MMSAGKAEISKLSNAMDETAKTVKELRTELYKRRSAKVAAISKDLSSNNELEFYRAGTGHNNDPKAIKVSGIPMIDDVECPSSGLTEEPEPQLLEMDQLEAELASELQKLLWSYPEASGHEGVEPNMDKVSLFKNMRVLYSLDFLTSKSHALPVGAFICPYKIWNNLFSVL